MSQNMNERQSEFTRRLVLTNLLPLILEILTILAVIIAYVSDYFYAFMFGALVLSVTSSLVSYWTFNQSVILIRHGIEEVRSIVTVEDIAEFKLRSSLVRSMVAKSFSSSLIVFALLIGYTNGVVSFAPLFVLALVYNRWWNKVKDIRLKNYMEYFEDTNLGR